MTKITAQNISKICSERLSENMPDTNAGSRLQKELDYILKNEAYAEVFTVASELALYSRELGYCIGFHGCIGSSLVAFLLGITEIDPLIYNLPIEVFTGIYNDKPLDIEMMFAQFERDCIADRTMEGLKAARGRGRVGGRPRINSEQVKRAVKLYNTGQYALKEIEELTGVKKDTLYRNLKNEKGVSLV